MMSPEMQVIKASLKDKNMRLGIEQILRAMVHLMPNHEEELVSWRLFFFFQLSCLCVVCVLWFIGCAAVKCYKIL